MVAGRIAVGFIMSAIVLGLFMASGSIDELPYSVDVLVYIAVILLMAYCVGSGVYLLIKAGVI